MSLQYETPKNYNDLENLFLNTLNGDEHKIARVGLALEHANDVRHLMKDRRSLEALKVCQCYVDGQATDEELRAAYYEANNVAAVAAFATEAAAAAVAAFATEAATKGAFAAKAAEAAEAAAHASNDECIDRDGPLPQKILDRLEKWFPRTNEKGSKVSLQHETAHALISNTPVENNPHTRMTMVVVLAVAAVFITAVIALA